MKQNIIEYLVNNIKINRDKIIPIYMATKGGSRESRVIKKERDVFRCLFPDNNWHCTVLFNCCTALILK